MRGERPFVFTNLKENKGVAEVASFVETKGGLEAQERTRSPLGS